MRIEKHVCDEERTSLTVSIDQSELHAHLEECYGLIAARYGIYSDSGPAIMEELEKRVGSEEAQKLLVDLVMNASAPYAITTERIDMISSPLFFPEDTVKPDEPFTYSMSLLTKPMLQLTSYAPLEIAIPPDMDAEDRNDFLRAAVVFALADRLKTTISDEIYEVTFSDIQKATEMDLAARNIDFDTYLEQQGIEKQQYQMMLMLQAREQLKQNFALDALAQHLAIEPTESDCAAACEEIAPGQGDVVLESFRKTSRLFVIEEAARRMRARQWLVDTAVVVIEDHANDL